jgi:DNA (cytosine-5)-methyltransferase 1
MGERLVEKLKAISLFSGCGGLDVGASLAGIETSLAIDIDSIAIETLRHNLRTNAIVADLTKLDGIPFPTDAQVILGGPPCQGFSSAGPKNQDDPRNKLWLAYLNVLKKVRPRAFLVENVPGFESELPSFLKELENSIPGHYKVFSKKLISQYYGVPQFRHRIFVIGLDQSASKKFSWPEPTDIEVFNYTKAFPSMVTMKKALEDLGEPAASEDIFGPGGLDHVHTPLSNADAAIARHIPNGGSLKDIPDAFLPAPYAGRTRGPKGWTWYFRKPRPELPARSVIASIRPNFSTVLAPDVRHVKQDGCWTWKEVVHQEYTNDGGLYTSPVSPRRLTVREYARIQTFPDTFVFLGRLVDKYRVIGNAVPCELARRLCISIREALE